MDRRQFIRVSGLMTVAWMSAVRVKGAAGARTEQDRPNILFILIDDLGPEWVGCYGAEDIETPHIDALAAGGMRFENAYAMPKCTPTRVSLLTGQYPWRTGWINHWDVPRWGAGCHFDWRHYTSFARVLKTAGYATAAAGKWQINDFRVQPEAMAEHGFDDWCMWTGFETGNPASAERYWNPYIHTKAGSRTYQGRFGTDVFVEFLIDFMKRHHNEPMLLYFPMCLTHGPLTTTPAEPGVTGNRARHQAMVRYMDRAVGHLVKALEDLGLRDQTLVFFTADNGTSGGVSGRMNGRMVRGGKGTLSETGCRVPFVVGGPGRVPAGVVTDALTDVTDMLPTFAELAGVSIPEGVTVDGRSIAPLLLGRAKDSPRRWVMAMGGGVARIEDGRVVPEKAYADRVVRDKRYKLWIEEGRPSRLFDLRTDPAETRNLIESPDAAHVAARQRLAGAASAWPTADARPRYEPTPAQPWDKTSSNESLQESDHA